MAAENGFEEGSVSSQSLCETCRQINIEALASPEGFEHLPWGNLGHDMIYCSLCWYIYIQAPTLSCDYESLRGVPLQLKLTARSLEKVDKPMIRISLKNPHGRLDSGILDLRTAQGITSVLLVLPHG